MDRLQRHVAEVGEYQVCPDLTVPAYSAQASAALGDATGSGARHLHLENLHVHVDGAGVTNEDELARRVVDRLSEDLDGLERERF